MLPTSIYTSFRDTSNSISSTFFSAPFPSLNLATLQFSGCWLSSQKQWRLFGNPLAIIRIPIDHILKHETVNVYNLKVAEHFWIGDFELRLAVPVACDKNYIYAFLERYNPMCVVPTMDYAWRYSLMPLCPTF